MIDMYLTIGELKEAIERWKLSDDAQIFIEYPQRYGLQSNNSGEIRPETIRWMENDENDYITASKCCSADIKQQRLYINHHY